MLKKDPTLPVCGKRQGLEDASRTPNANHCAGQGTRQRAIQGSQDRCPDTSRGRRGAEAEGQGLTVASWPAGGVSGWLHIVHKICETHDEKYHGASVFVIERVVV